MTYAQMAQKKKEEREAREAAEKAAAASSVAAGGVDGSLADEAKKIVKDVAVHKKLQGEVVII
jgi:hypothetical protein